jgi:hypothetical protein
MGMEFDLKLSSSISFDGIWKQEYLRSLYGIDREGNLSWEFLNHRRISLLGRAAHPVRITGFHFESVITLIKIFEDD